MTVKRPISKAFIILSLFAILLLGFSTFGFSTIYYVNTAADAGGDGTTQELTGEHCAFKTIAQVNAASPAAGSSILFNKGNEWREKLTVPTSGSDGSPITFGAYGSGNDPIINGADLVTTWSDEGSNVWSATLATGPNIVFFDGTKGTNDVTPDTDYDWYYDSNTLYIYSTYDPDTAYTDPGIETAKRDGFRLDNKDYITIQNLHMTHADWHGIKLQNGASNVIIDTCTIDYCRVDGICCNDSDGPAIDSVTIQNCTVSYCDETGVSVGQYATNWTIYNNNVQYCDESGVNSASGIGVWGNNATSGGHIIQNNIVKNNWHGIHIDQVATSCTLRYNWVESNNNEGIFMEKVVGDEVYYNISINNAANGIGLKGVAGDPCNEQKIYNNLCYGNGNYNICVGGNGANSVCNNIIKNNICDNATYLELCARDGGENDGTNGSGNVYEYNCFGTEYTDFIRWGATDYSTYDTWETAYSGSTYSVESDPLMTDPANDNFKLNPHSPCVNAGTDVSLTEDYEGLKIRHAPDIGAYENQTNALFFAWNLFKQWWY